MPNRLRVGLIFGGRSAEHEVSIRSAQSIAAALDRDKFEVVPIAIDRRGVWHLKDAGNYLLPGAQFPLSVAEAPGNLLPVVSSVGEKFVDVVFPITHGPYGEDGTLQGMLRLANLPFVGPSVLGSAVGMDKDVMKRLLRDGGLPIGKFHVLRRGECADYSLLSSELSQVLYVKPANMGSSVGVSRVSSKEELENAIREAFLFDTKVIIEEEIRGREIEVSVLGNESPRASLPGEVIPKDGFYSYDAKYVNEDGAVLSFPAELTADQISRAQELAVTVFQTLCCEGMARVDLFLKESGEFVVNEINTLPGFTSISMYPKLWEVSGLSYSALLEELIRLALERYERDSKLLSEPGL